ncbi:hypothetical protein [Pontibacter kalidii]|uniref:hypothetical protein n=1 Tax=Pontibacter kalidii TaxID=2592049 RepID=UPI0022592237|nr:hypothetical protein [Pontibacter kalidii]
MSKKKNWIIHKLIPGILFFGSLSAIVVYIQWEQNLLNEYHRYTIGVATEIYWTVASGKKLRFEYVVNGESYFRSNRYNDRSRVPGRYFVKFSAERPSISEILQDIPVPDSIIAAPSEGWQEIPVKLEK